MTPGVKEKETTQVVLRQFECDCANPTPECRDDQNWRYKLCNATRHYLFTRCRYPAFTGDYIRRRVDKPDTRPDELQAYMENSSEIRRNKALVIVFVYLTYCLKNLFVPLETLRMFNYDDLESNIKLVAFNGGGGGGGGGGSTSSLTSSNSGPIAAAAATTTVMTTAPETIIESREIIKLFTCLATNCSHFSPLSADETQLVGDPSRLARDISKLPMFKLCHPKINSWYSPVTALDSLGVLMLLCVSFNAFLLGSWITIQQLIFPAGNEMIMFIVAPAVTARMAWQRTRELLASVSSSYAHFCLNSKLRFFTQTEHEYLHYSARLASLESTWSPGGPGGQIQARRGRHKSAGKRVEEGPERAGVLKPLRSDRQLDAMASECLPIIRTCWWRRTITNIFLCVLLATVCEILTISGFAFKYIKKSLTAKESQLASFASEMRRQDCQLWYAGNAAEATNVRVVVEPAAAAERQLIDMSRLGLKWTTFSRFEGGLFNVMPALGVSMMFAYYWAVIGEIEIWLAELRTFLVATLVVSRVKLSRASGGGGGGGGGEQQPTDRSSFLLPGPISLPAQAPMRPRTYTNASISSYGSGSISAISSSSSSSSNSSRALVSGNSERTRSHLHIRIETEHFYNMSYLRRMFQQEIGSIAMCYFTRMKSCHIRREDGAVVHANQTSAFDSNEKVVFKMREIKFMELIHKHVKHHNHQGLQAGPHSGRQLFPAGLDELTVELDGPVLDEDEDDFAHDIYTMEQVYVNFRLFIEHVHGLAPSMGVVLAITYLLNYGLVCISVMCSRKFSDLKTEMMFVVVFGWFVSNILILLAANFHANAKKLQPLMWSIIAQLTRSQDNRVKHLRFLWIKQAQILDNQGGLALDAFGLRVTYVNMIQIIIWTVTIIVMALKS